MSNKKTNKSEVISSRVGIINRLIEAPVHHDDPTIYSYGALMADTTRYAPHQCNLRNGGAGFTQNAAISASIGESIERYCSIFYDRKDLRFGSHIDLNDQAISPSKWVLYSQRQYESNNLPFSEFKPSSKIWWVEATSCITEKKWFVPASMVFLPYKLTKGEARISPSISTGLSCGTSITEAVLFGIYECIERDAFTIFWLNALCMPNVLPDKIPDLRIQNIFEDRFKRPGLKYFIYDITLDIPITTFFTLTIGTSNIGKMLCVGSASNLNKKQALLKSLLETAQARPYLRYERLKKPIWSCKPDFSDVNTFDDHALVYNYYPNLISNLSFCTTTGSKFITDLRNNSRGNPEDDLKKVINILKRKNFDILVVKLATPDVKAVGLEVVKVLIPGLQPLHGDHRYPFLGGNRLYEVPYKLGLTESPSNEDKLFSYPHPFP